MIDVHSAVLVLTFFTLYIIAFVGYAFDSSDEVSNDGAYVESSFLFLWGEPAPRKNLIGVVPEGAIKAKSLKRSSLKRISSTAKNLFNSALNKIQNKNPPASSIPRLSWEIEASGHSDPLFVPILCFVNSKSGGQQGKHLQKQLLQLLSKHQVFDLAAQPPLPILLEYAKLPSVIILVCGGDGTVNWVLDSLDMVGTGTFRLCVLPIGTGNDLAVHLGWVDYFSEHTLCPRVLYDILHADSVHIDRYSVVHGGVRKHFVNYLGVGLDALIVRDFAALRQRRPHLFLHAY
ncbi:hypothetical protein EON65_53585, partial [archaeon]